MRPSSLKKRLKCPAARCEAVPSTRGTAAGAIAAGCGFHERNGYPFGPERAQRVEASYGGKTDEVKCPSCAAACSAVASALAAPDAVETQPGVGVTPMEVVVRLSTGLHRHRERRPRAPARPGLGRRALRRGPARVVRAGRPPSSTPARTRCPGSSIGWRALGIVLAAMLAVILHTLCWGGG